MTHCYFVFKQIFEKKSHLYSLKGENKSLEIEIHISWCIAHIKLCCQNFRELEKDDCVIARHCQ